MEEAKVTDVAKLLASEGVFWQWQSGLDPWAEEDPAKWTWQGYSHDDCHIIEQAFLLKKDIANLKDYEVDLKKMLQVNKRLKDRIRRVRRQKSRFLMEMSEPKVIGKDQKTMNPAFGSIEHFLEYIMKRTPKAYGLYQRLKALTLDSTTYEFEDIVKEVLACLDKGAEAREKIIKARFGSETTNFLAEAKKIGELIRNSSKTLGDFLKAILKAYTMETFVCYWLNELLRSEDWEEINVLIPYLVCLVYTFKCSEFFIKYQEPRGVMSNLRVYFGMKRTPLSLYRGVVLTKKHFNLYDLDKIKYFSWNSITSTSRDKNVAHEFIKQQLNKAKQLNEPKIGVFFKIETSWFHPEERKGMIDLSQGSEYPDEQEVILAPGTVFELLNIHLLEKNIYKICLKVTKKFEETKDHISLLGTLQDRSILENKAIIYGLPSQESFAVLELLKGNKLIQQLEIRNSEIEDHIMEEIENLRVTTNIQKQNIKLGNNKIVASSLNVLAYYFSAENLDNIFICNKIRFRDRESWKSKDMVLKTLVLSEKALERFQRNNWDWFKTLHKQIINAGDIEHIDLSIEWHRLEDWLKLIKELKQLQSLRIKFNENEPIPRDVLEIICQKIACLSSLNRLHLGLTLPNEALISLEKSILLLASVQYLSLSLNLMINTSNTELTHLSTGLPSLISLQHLSLAFPLFNNIPDDGLDHIKSVLISFKDLQRLSFNFKNCNEVSDEGLHHLKSGLISLISLQHLSLDFTGGKQITDEGLNHLKSGLIYLVSLQHLSLDFTVCKQITDEGLNHLKSGLRPLVSLVHLSLHFGGCRKISDKGLNFLENALESLTSLQHMSLDFDSCNISYDGLDHLKSGLISLRSLQHLSLNFNSCTFILDEGLNHLKSALISLTYLQHLSLHFNSCTLISDEGLNHLKRALISLKSLQHLSLNFNSCTLISDEGLNHLKCALVSLTILQHLSLHFDWCTLISDEGLNYLKSALVSLISLQHLSLHFDWCNKRFDNALSHVESSLHQLFFELGRCRRISDEGLNLLERSFESIQHFSQNFKDRDKYDERKFLERSLRSLQHLFLELGRSRIISDEGLNLLKRSFTSLQDFFSLQFEKCNTISRKIISDEGLNNLKSGLVSLISLQHLSLNFNGCKKISNERLNYLKDDRKSLTSLQYGS